MISTRTIVTIVVGAVLGVFAWQSSDSMVVGAGVFAFGTSVLVYFEGQISDLLDDIAQRMR
jgi:hypothetical protein